MDFQEDVTNTVKREDLDQITRAGKTAAALLTKAKDWLRPGINKLQICEKIEQAIRKLSAIPAFPVNLSVNEQAAHYTSPPFDKSVLPNSGVAKLDIGVSINGWLVDTAISIALSKKYENLVRVCKEALDKAITLIKDGIRVKTISAAIQDSIESTGAGFVPIKNLSGHQINQFDLHAGMTIPNVKKTDIRTKLKTGMILAIEPFVTTSKQGWVITDPSSFIYSIKEPGKSTLTQSIWDKRNRLPFCTRWYPKLVEKKTPSGLATILEKDRNVISYPVLVDQEQGIISHFEHTLIVDKNGCTVLTHPN